MAITSMLLRSELRMMITFGALARQSAPRVGALRYKKSHPTWARRRTDGTVTVRSTLETSDPGMHARIQPQAAKHRGGRVPQNPAGDRLAPRGPPDSFTEISWSLETRDHAVAAFQRAFELGLRLSKTPRIHSSRPRDAACKLQAEESARPVIASNVVEPQPNSPTDDRASNAVRVPSRRLNRVLREMPA